MRLKLTSGGPGSSSHGWTYQAMTLPIPEGFRLRARCPGCGREFVWHESADRPFCSTACRLIDLGVWLDESYRISPVEDSPSETLYPEE